MGETDGVFLPLKQLKFSNVSGTQVRTLSETMTQWGGMVTLLEGQPPNHDSTVTLSLPEHLY